MNEIGGRVAVGPQIAAQEEEITGGENPDVAHTHHATQPLEQRARGRVGVAAIANPQQPKPREDRDDDADRHRDRAPPSGPTHPVGCEDCPQRHARAVAPERDAICEAELFGWKPETQGLGEIGRHTTQRQSKEAHCHQQDRVAVGLAPGEEGGGHRQPAESNHPAHPEAVS